MTQTLHPMALVGFLIVGFVGAVGLYASYRNVRKSYGPKERKFVMWACAATWSIIALLLLLVWFVPPPYSYVIAVLYVFLFSFFIYRAAKTRLLIREKEERERAGTVTPLRR